MSVWVYDVVSKSHRKVEADSVAEFVVGLEKMYEHVMDDARECEKYGENQRNLLVFTTNDSWAHMNLSVYEKHELGDVRVLSKGEVEVVEKLMGGPTDAGDYILEINNHAYKIPMASMLELAVTTIALDRAIKALDEEKYRCAIN